MIKPTTLLCSFLLLNFNLFSQSWESENKNGFIANCISEATSSMGKNGAIQYCACMLDRIINAYPDPGEADQMTTDEIMPMAVDCVETLSNWEESVKNEFLTNCIEAGKADMGEESATIYCNCMLNRLSIKFPDSEDYDMSETEIQAVAATCLY